MRDKKKRVGVDIIGEDRYQALVNSAHHHIFMLDREGVYLESNRQVSQFGLENGDALVGMCLDDLFPQELAETYTQQMERVLATGLEVEFEHPMSIAGSEQEFLVTLYPIYRYGEIQAVGGISRDITESKRAERAFRLAEERYRSIYENAVEGIFQSTPDGQFLNVNPAMARIYGYTSVEEMITSIDSEIDCRVYVDSRRRADFISALREEGVITEFENQNYRKDGGIIWTRTNARAVYDDKDRILYFEGFLTDISERKRAEEALLESEQRFHSLFDNTTIGLYRTTPDGQILMANPAITQMLGYDSFEEMASNNLEQDGFEPAYQRSQFRHLIETEGAVKGLEAIWNRKDGKQIYVRESAKAVRDSDGTVLYYEGTVEDVTERKQAEEALREAAAEWQSTFDAVSDAVCLLDADQRILRCNQAMSRLCKKSAEELVGKLCYEIVHGTGSAITECPILRTRATHQRESLELNVGERWFEATVDPILENDRLVGATHILRDITEHRRAEEEVKAALAEKVVLLREVHHRVKNNLATISSLLDLQARTSQDAGVHRAFQECQQRIRSMTQIHEQLYRSDSLSHIDMSKYVAGLAEELRIAYSKGEIEVRVDVQQVRLTIDQAIPCGLVINELVTNALKYAFPAEEVPDVASGGLLENLHRRLVLVSMHSEGDRCRLRVSDNGIGLPPELDIQSTRTLGLRLVSRLAGQLGGKLTIDSHSGSAGGGAVFQIDFPIRK